MAATIPTAPRTYAGALSLLETIQSNRFVQKFVSTGTVASKNGNADPNAAAIPEMLDWLRKAGYVPSDFSDLNLVHVAGTKGKGSVCAMISSILQQYDDPAGSSTPPGLGAVALYTSPHLVSVRERITINGAPISKELFTKHFFELWDRFNRAAEADGHLNPAAAPHETKPGYFRFLTILALHVFLQEGIRSAVIECGIGGEYDSTNILAPESVVVCAITKLGIDHVGMLGSTVESIAWHKAGIMKEGVQCFTVPQEAVALNVLEKRAVEKDTNLKVVERLSVFDEDEVQIGLEGDFQKDNASLAIAVAEAYLNKVGIPVELQDGKKLPPQFLRGLKNVQWRGRCEVRTDDTGLKWCIDGAHTLDSIEVTAKWFAEKLKQSSTSSLKAVLIFNQQDRNVAPLLQKLYNILREETGKLSIFPHAVFCTNTPSKAEAAASADGPDLTVQNVAADAWRNLEKNTDVKVCGSIQEGVEFAREITKGQKGALVLVTGSLYLVGGAIQVLDGDLGKEV